MISQFSLARASSRTDSRSSLYRTAGLSVVIFLGILIGTATSTVFRASTAFADGGGGGDTAEAYAEYFRKKARERKAKARARRQRRRTSVRRRRQSTTVKASNKRRSARTRKAASRKPSDSDIAARKAKAEQERLELKSWADKAKREAETARDNLQKATGGKTAKAAIEDLRSNMYFALLRYEAIEEHLAKLDERAAGLAGDKKSVDDKSVFTPGDLAGKAGTTTLGKAGASYLNRKAGERLVEAAENEAEKALAREAAKAGVKSGASRFLGWAAWVGDGIKYGGRKYFKERLSSTLEEYIKQHNVTRHELITIQLELQGRRNRDREAIKRIQRLARIEEKAYSKALEAEQAAQPAVKSGNLRRVFDHEGDKREARLQDEHDEKKRKERARRTMKIEVVPDQKPQPARTKRKVRRTKTIERRTAHRYHDSHFRGH